MMIFPSWLVKKQLRRLEIIGPIFSPDIWGYFIRIYIYTTNDVEYMEYMGLYMSVYWYIFSSCQLFIQWMINHQILVYPLPI